MNDFLAALLSAIVVQATPINTDEYYQHNFAHEEVREYCFARSYTLNELSSQPEQAVTSVALKAEVTDNSTAAGFYLALKVRGSSDTYVSAGQCRKTNPNTVICESEIGGGFEFVNEYPKRESAKIILRKPQGAGYINLLSQSSEFNEEFTLTQGTQDTVFRLLPSRCE